MRLRRAAPIVVIAGALGFLLSAGITWLVVSSTSTPHEPLDLTYIPADAEEIHFVRVARICEAPIVQDVLASAERQAQIQDMSREWGVSPADILSRTVASMADGSDLTVLRTRSALARELILSHAASHERISHPAGPYYRVGAAAVWFPDDTTMIHGPEPLVIAAIQAGRKTAVRPDIAFADGSADIVMVHTGESALTTTSWEWGYYRIILEGPVLQRGLDDESVVSSATCVSFSEGVTIIRQYHLDTERTAAVYASDGSALIRKLGAVWRMGARDEDRERRLRKGDSPQEAEQWLAEADAMFSTADVARDGRTVSISLTLPGRDTTGDFIGPDRAAFEIREILENPAELFGLGAPEFQAPAQSE